MIKEIYGAKPTKEIYAEKESVNINVTDYSYVDGLRNNRVGYLMNRYLYNRFKGVKTYLEKDNALIGLYTGSGKTRIGKSFKAFQDAYFMAWTIAGGKVDDKGNVISTPVKEVKVHYYFDMKHLADEIANSTEEYRVYILDEGDEGAGSRTALSKRNREFKNMITRSALKKYVLLIVSPDFFGLNHHWACTCSDYLVNVFRSKNRRGYFNFYDSDKKSLLYDLGKKTYGSSRYFATFPNFYGTFPNMFPGDFKEYNQRKVAALESINEKEPAKKNITMQRDIANFKYYEASELTIPEAAENLGISHATLERSIARAREILGAST